MRIRDAVAEDLDQLASFVVETQQLHVDAYPDVYSVITVQNAITFLTEQLAKEATYLRVAEEAGRVVGCCFFELRRSIGTPFTLPRTMIYLSQISVDEKHRRHGIGEALIRDMRRIAAAEDVHRIELNVWEFNADAQRFFAVQGFRAFGRRMASDL